MTMLIIGFALRPIEFDMHSVTHKREGCSNTIEAKTANPHAPNGSPQWGTHRRRAQPNPILE
ncbi:hypothetical protein CS8_048200 [Cupriavidus sp. 8B]